MIQLLDGFHVNAMGDTEPTNVDVTLSLGSGVWLVTPKDQDDYSFFVAHSSSTPLAAARRGAAALKAMAGRLPEVWSVYPLSEAGAIDVNSTVSHFSNGWLEVRL